MVKERKNICILGAGKMGLEYSNILRSKRYKIFAASSSSPNSKSWALFKKKNPEASYLNNDEILNNTKCNYIISCLPHLMQIDYFPKLMKSNKKILIEKPFSLNSKIYKKIIKKNLQKTKNKFLAFNRREYETVKILKKRLKKNDVKYVDVKVSENTKKNSFYNGKKFKKYFPYYGSSSHIIDLLFYFFDDLQVKRKWHNWGANVKYPSVYSVLEGKKKFPIFLFIEKDTPLKIGIDVIFRDNTLWSLSPIEKLTVYKGYNISKITKKNRYLKYEQKIIYEKIENSKQKPGFQNQIINFVENKIKITNFQQYYNYLKFYEKIFLFK